jgi:hypothetical protein
MSQWKADNAEGNQSDGRKNAARARRRKGEQQQETGNVARQSPFESKVQCSYVVHPSLPSNQRDHSTAFTATFLKPRLVVDPVRALSPLAFVHPPLPKIAL